MQTLHTQEDIDKERHHNNKLGAGETQIAVTLGVRLQGEWEWDTGRKWQQGLKKGQDRERQRGTTRQILKTTETDKQGRSGKMTKTVRKWPRQRIAIWPKHKQWWLRHIRKKCFNWYLSGIDPITDTYLCPVRGSNLQLPHGNVHQYHFTLVSTVANLPYISNPPSKHTSRHWFAFGMPSLAISRTDHVVPHTDHVWTCLIRIRCYSHSHDIMLTVVYKRPK
jgi:hypothetical protein